MSMRTVILTIILCLLLVPLTHAAGPEVIIYPKPLSAYDTRFDYHLALLREALDRTVDEYGSYELRPTEVTMNQLRQFNLLQSGSSLLDIAIKPSSIEREKVLTPVRIPLEKGLLGWRIMLIDHSNQPAISKVEDIEDLRAYIMGQGLGWPDVKILTHNGFIVREGGNYEGLFKMLLSARFQLFPRGMSEALHEWDVRHTSMPNLHVEETLLLHYPYMRYFWTANSPKGKWLNARITRGLESMIQDGTFDAMFMERYGEIIKRAQPNRRRLIELENPDLPPKTPLERKELWFSPL